MGIRHKINPIGAVLTETQLPCKVIEIQILAHGIMVGTNETHLSK